ncbi:FAD-binding protein [Pannonibacter phragmitetus]|uniref:FAD-binding protein n=1 Tax=Pannonibacter phragmitetus TaxID=121719 RepID=UPI003D2EBD90
MTPDQTTTAPIASAPGAALQAVRPRNAEELRDLVAHAAAEDLPLEIIGQGSKRALGRPVQAGLVADLSALSGILVYEPAELVLTALAGTPLAEIEAAVAAAGQELSFEPMDYGLLLGGTPAQGTLGGTLAANLSGPRRIKVGAARDHVLGLEAVSGRGDLPRRREGGEERHGLRSAPCTLRLLGHAGAFDRTDAQGQSTGGNQRQSVDRGAGRCHGGCRPLPGDGHACRSVGGGASA